MQKFNAAGAGSANIKTWHLDGRPVVEITGATANDLHTDSLGSTVLRTDASRTATAATQYDPWGDTWAGNEPSSFGFTGHIQDGATGLVYMRKLPCEADSGFLA